MSEYQQKTISIEELIERDKKLNQQNKSVDIEISKDDLHKAKVENRYYLPILHLNDPTQWPPAKKRRRFTDKVATETCLYKCCGHPGLNSACCQMDPDDLEHVLGPITDKDIKRIIKHFKKIGIILTRSDVAIDFEEGKVIGQTFFNGHPIFNSPTSYPIMRFQIIGPRFACKFLNPTSGKCSIYEHRPEMCRGYYCNYIKSNFLVRTKNHPNSYRRID